VASADPQPRGHWPLLWDEEIRRILEGALNTDAMGVREKVETIISVLAAKGQLRYRDLLK
jgi:hypothetical protein